MRVTVMVVVMLVVFKGNSRYSAILLNCWLRSIIILQIESIKRLMHPRALCDYHFFVAAIWHPALMLPWQWCPNMPMLHPHCLYLCACVVSERVVLGRHHLGKKVVEEWGGCAETLKWKLKRQWSTNTNLYMVLQVCSVSTAKSTVE